jgi:hypothetical protein
MKNGHAAPMKNSNHGGWRGQTGERRGFRPENMAR